MAKTKTTNNQSSFLTNPIFIGAIVIVIIALISIVIVWLTSVGESATVENNRQPDQISQTGNQPTQDSDNVKPDVPQYEGESPNDLDELTGQVRYMQQSDGFLTVSAMINQYLSENGTCMMVLTGRKTGKTYTATSVAEPDVTTSTCGLLKVALQDVTSDYYDIEIKLEGDGKKGTIKTEGVEI